MIRLFHGHDEVVAIPGSDQSEEEQRWGTQKTYKQPRLGRSVMTHTPHLTEPWLPGSSHVPRFINKKPLTADALLSRGSPNGRFVVFVPGVAANTDKSPRRNWASSGATKAVEDHSHSARFQQMCLCLWQQGTYSSYF